MCSAMHPTVPNRHVRAVITGYPTLGHSLQLSDSRQPRVAGTTRGKNTHGRLHARTSANLLHARHWTDCCTAALLHSHLAPFIHTSDWLPCSLHTSLDPRHCHAALQPLNSSGNSNCIQFLQLETLPCSFIHQTHFNLHCCIAASFNLFLAKL